MKKVLLIILVSVLTVLYVFSSGCGSPANESGAISADSSTDGPNTSANESAVSVPGDESFGESETDAESGSGESEVGQNMSSNESGEYSGTGEISDGKTVSEPSRDESADPVTAEKDYPVVSGTFMQPSFFAGYSEERLIKHLEYMREVGIDKIILQWSFVTENEKVQSVYFKQSFSQGDRAATIETADSGFLEKLLSAARKTGFKVFVGLNDSSEWWEKGVNDPSWIRRQAELGVKGAKQIYDEYKPKYGNTLCGWYFVFEFYNMYATPVQIKNAAGLLNLYLNGLNSFSPEMPMMLSPFISAAGAGCEATRRLWTEVFAQTDFREGDIFCCQDSVGAGHIHIEQLDGYFKAIKAAVDTEPGLRFWANNEDFTQADWSTAPLDRFVEQLNISSQYTDTHVTFAYSHYQNPDTGKTGYHNAYKYYYDNGALPQCRLEAPKIEYTASKDGSVVKISAVFKDETQTLRGIKITKNGELLRYFDKSAEFGAKEYSAVLTDYNHSTSGKAEYKIYATDYSGGDGPAFAFTVECSGRSGRNAAAGKGYIIDKAPEDSYPDEDGITLTDGNFGQAAYYDSAWCGFLGRPSVVIDLGQIEKSIYAFEIGTLGGGYAGVYSPVGIKIEVSSDGKVFKTVADAEFDPDKGVDSSVRIVRDVPIESDAEGRYVKFTFTTDQSWIFIDEIKVFAD